MEELGENTKIIFEMTSCLETFHSLPRKKRGFKKLSQKQ